MDDVLKRLLESEHTATGLVQAAEEEAFQRITKVKTELQAQYTELLKLKRLELDAQLKEKQARLLTEREEKNLAYAKELAKATIFKEDFQKRLRELLKLT